jgi:cation diffusion facilitator CzcD-associated flavoprotein CzcO
METERIAIIGSGVSGLICSWLLTREDANQPKLTIYEKNDYLGGHTNTVDIVDEKVFTQLTLTKHPKESQNICRHRLHRLQQPQLSKPQEIL